MIGSLIVGTHYSCATAILLSDSLGSMHVRGGGLIENPDKCAGDVQVIWGESDWREMNSARLKKALVAQSCPTLCDPMDRSPPSSSVHGILQARIVDWIAIPFPRGSSQPRD